MHLMTPTPEQYKSTVYISRSASQNAADMVIVLLHSGIAGTNSSHISQSVQSRTSCIPVQAVCKRPGLVVVKWKH